MSPYVAKVPYADRFWTHVDKSPDCWLWTAVCNDKGYGIVNLEGHARLAHRVAWTITNGPIPKGLFVLHQCDNPPCVNPAHLSLGTQADNLADAAIKGRMQRGTARPTAKLTEAQVIGIRGLLSDGASLSSIARLAGVSRGTVTQIRDGRAWAWVA